MGGRAVPVHPGLRLLTLMFEEDGTEACVHITAWRRACTPTPLPASPRPPPRRPQASKVISRFDINGDDKINFDEFLLFQALLSIPVGDLEVAFRLMDKGGFYQHARLLGAQRMPPWCRAHTPMLQTTLAGCSACAAVQRRLLHPPAAALQRTSCHTVPPPPPRCRRLGQGGP